MKTQRWYTDEYLEQCKKTTPEQIAKFLEEGRKLLMMVSDRKKMISIRIPDKTLELFKLRCRAEGIPYQKKINDLMYQWLVDNPATKGTVGTK